MCELCGSENFDPQRSKRNNKFHKTKRKMFLPAAVVTSLLAFLQGTAATASDASNNQRYSDELIAAMVKTAKEHQLTSATAAATAVNGLRPSMINQILAKGLENFFLSFSYFHF
jgi:hypothetical protein